MLVVERLTKRFGDRIALDDVGFEVPAGEIVGFLGPNGAGKTTTMRAIMGLVVLDDGSVTWQSKPIDPVVRQRFGYMPAERGMYQQMKVREHLVYYATLCGLRTSAGSAADHWLHELGLSDRADDTVQSLSSGNQQRVQLALALLNHPQLLVLDEPFSGLDPIAVEMLSDVLRRQVADGVALLLSSHQLDLVADVCNSVVIVDQGQVVLRGDVAEIRAASATRYLDIEFSRPTDLVAGPPEHAGPAGGVAAVGAVGAPIVDADRRRYRIALPANADPGAMIARAQASGPVLSYSFAPPDLSEVFLGAVERHPRDVPAPAAGPSVGVVDE